ncbi:ComF family protein [Candidatus Methylacidiphilum fumarolicum]|uniref:Predicted amidophosphoribosyltransferase ComF n=1 Tax=Methylacidiphilum fumariolicum (strain SolV) TaxID=1156937 RepID=I0JZJ9_METFB|nr:phosphoribosyltransferase family protein [Candidatus Methylacidiphilum fumarolicum]MBW6415446.1 ComF family protein [Candidatus Methylacidiphilum fumarolicum]TFE69016.1 amidophosphoribosyltransferase [Candidatus Methylacidiphilum fumarolicum]TFE74043.1 ComF family protein [Candidatus Methylacidiphilum fumarolicum]TFE74153.1 amidophosphoribosyltransferase [Candidatus Methylacidiphilum fumarolicum]TFE74930.1 ComF family protein [Candidatus Methylacidiphilum fumarolicum]
MDLLQKILWEIQREAQCFLSLIYPPPKLPNLSIYPLDPPFCYHCCLPFPKELPYLKNCKICSTQPRSFLFARAGFVFSGLVQEVIQRVKYHNEYHLIGILEEWLEKGYKKYIAGWRCHGVVPVPLHPKKFRKRGFNLAEELALSLCRRQQLEYLPALKRVKFSQQQTGLSLLEKSINIRDSFRLKRGFDLSAKNLLIIDDIMFTGATVEACAEVLKKEGRAQEIAVLTIARN